MRIKQIYISAISMFVALNILIALFYNFSLRFSDQEVWIKGVFICSNFPGVVVIQLVRESLLSDATFVQLAASILGISIIVWGLVLIFVGGRMRRSEAEKDRRRL